MTLHRVSLWILYLVTIAAVGYVVAMGGGYYALSLGERPHSTLHAAWKPSGSIGHGIGIVGSVLMVILLLYSARKRLRFMQNAGNIRFWLNYHIWMGVTGPLLVIFHTCFKLGGIVVVSFWSMVGVALSGVLGRYLYLQIPHSLSGQELSARELDEMDRGLQKQLQEHYKLDESALQMIQQASGADDVTQRAGWGGFWYWLVQDITLPARLRKIRHELRKVKGLHGAEMHQAMNIVKHKVKLRRRMAFLSTAQSLLHHWHVIHRPFALVMLVIMVVHVVVTILFGYRWIF
jgi:hypothetical protein